MNHYAIIRQLFSLHYATIRVKLNPFFFVFYFSAKKSVCLFWEQDINKFPIKCVNFRQQRKWLCTPSIWTRLKFQIGYFNDCSRFLSWSTSYIFNKKTSVAPIRIDFIAICKTKLSAAFWRMLLTCHCQNESLVAVPSHV